MTLLSHSAGSVNFYGNLAQLSASYPAVTYDGFDATTSDFGPVWSIGGAWSVGSALPNSYTPPGTGAVPTTVAAKLGQTVSVFDFMTAAQIADAQAGTLTLDMTAALQAAINTALAVYLPKANYLISSQLNFPNKGQKFFGDGHQATFITVNGPNAGFVAGIFNITSLESGPEFERFCLNCAQPAAPANYAALSVYPPMIYINVTPRVRITDVRLTGGINGVYMNGNCGGGTFTRVESGCYGRNWFIDGNLDVTQWVHCQVWPFSSTGIMTTQQQTVFITSGNCYGFYSLRNDYFNWIGGLFLCGNSAFFGLSGSGNSYGTFVGTGFDTFGGLTVNSGQVIAAGCTFSVGGILGAITLPAQNAATHTGGILNIVGGGLQVGSSSTMGNSAAFYSNSTTGGLTIDGMEMALTSADPVIAVVVAATDTSVIRIVNNGLLRQGSGVYTVPILSILGGAGTIANNTCQPNVSATGNINFLEMGTSIGPYHVSGNNNYNWGISITGSTVASAGTISIPPVFGDAMPIVTVTGTTNVFGITYTLVGVTAPYAGQIQTFRFAGILTVGSGVVGTASNPILNGRTNFTTAAASTLTLQLQANGNWQEIGRCA